MKDIKECAGVLIIARNTGRMLLLLRSEFCDAPLTWSMLAGHLKDGEDILVGLKREVEEEVGINPDIIDYYFINRESEGKFNYFIGFTDSEFKCKLDNENLNYGWFSKDNLPTPLYPGFILKINEL